MGNWSVRWNNFGVHITRPRHTIYAGDSNDSSRALRNIGLAGISNGSLWHSSKYLHCQPGGIFARTRSRPFTRTAEVVRRPRKIVPQFTDSGSAEPSFGVLAMADHPKASGATHDLLSIKDLHPRPAPFPGAPMANFHTLKVSFPGF